MKRSDSPSKQPKPFGINGQREDILPTTPSGDNTASYESGFPPITMILKSAGGLPPKGQDMNQILYELSALCRWASAGALNTFDSTFSSGIGGYPKGSLLFSDDGLKTFINTVDDNATNPNSGGAGWQDLFNFLGLASAAKVSVGDGPNNVPDMSFFANSLTGNGYQKLPGGYILQWMDVSASATASAYNIPIAWPTGCLQAVGTAQTGNDQTTTASAFVELGILPQQIFIKCINAAGTLQARGVTVIMVGR